MREIKFRVWNNYSKKWVYMNYRDVLMGIVTNSQSDAYDLDHKTLGQYTGLKDKNGIEIYEGDRMAYHPFYVTVYWNKKITGYYMKFDYDKKDMPLNYRLEDFEVIGNIHEE